MDKAQLLNELRLVPNSKRIQRMVAVGRQSLTDGRTPAVLVELAQGNVYERALAVEACHGSRDGKHILRSLTDPSRLVRGLAAGLLGRICTDDQIVQGLAQATLKQRRCLLPRLIDRGFVSIDALFIRRFRKLPADQRAAMFEAYGLAVGAPCGPLRKPSSPRSNRTRRQVSSGRIWLGWPSRLNSSVNL